MRRRHLLRSLACLPVLPSVARSAGAGDDLENPYADVDWQRASCLDSMSHQHQGQTEASLETFRSMGYGHFAFSNYYPSAPTYPLRAAFTQKHPEVIAAPNAEHHSFTDTGLHCNALGSLYASGYGRDTPAAERAASPLLRRFDGLTIFQEPRPWEGVYRLDVRLAARGKSAEATLTLTGARECHFREAFADLGPVTERRLGPGNHSLYLRAEAAAVDARLEFDPAALEVSQFRLMQGTNRPWREVFRAALDGEVIDGQRRGGLLLPEGGGLTLNHPTGKLADYAAMLDFDPRVLGIEVWNQLTSGFGSSRGFYDSGDGPLLHFYRLWDEILRSGRRCWGFFVKDHNTFGRGRNVLLLPPLEGLSIHDREAAALRAYRHGCFFGSVAALATNAAGEVVAPYDRSGFRFTRLQVRRDAEGRPEALEVAVGGQEAERRPNVQIRFITDTGIAAIADARKAEFPLARDAAGRLQAAFVRVEAFAYPATHLQGQPLSAEFLRGLEVDAISRLHDRLAPRGATFAGSDPALRTPLPIVDLIFSQPLRRL
jgi:hypothetical protein